MPHDGWRIGDEDVIVWMFPSRSWYLMSMRKNESLKLFEQKSFGFFFAPYRQVIQPVSINVGLVHDSRMASTKTF